MNRRLTATAAAATIAASIALHPLIASSTWFWEGVGAVIVVAGVASLTRIRPLPVLVCLPVTAFGLLLYVNLVFSRQHSFGGVLPTLASLAALVRLNSLGWAEAARFAPPVPGLRALSFLAVCGIGLAALFTDLVAVRLRKAAAAGVPLLALFSATVASKASAPSIDEAAIFSAGVAGYLALLVAEGRDRLSTWGRLVPIQPGLTRVISARQHTQRRSEWDAATATPDTHALSAAGRRVGVAAVAVALLVPLLVPGLKVRDLFGGGPGGSGRGGGTQATLPDPLVQLNRQLHQVRARHVLTYKSDDSDPSYLRVYSLDLTPTAGSWTLYIQQFANLAHNGKLPAAPGLRGATSRLTHTTVTVAHGVTGSADGGQRTQNFLPLPYPAVKVALDGSWAVDPGTLMVWSVNPISDLKYTVTSKDVQPTAAQLRGAGAPSAAAEQAVSVPPVYNSLAALARQITNGAATPYDKAVKLQQWFTAPGDFSYSLTASEPDSPAGLKDFLLRSRRGFCQQFAFGFAVLARLLNIPARVAVGYTAGTSQGGGSWRVNTTDAHAWPELYFQGAGWLPWEPTPPGDGAGQATARAPLYTFPTSGGTNPGGTGGPSGGTSPGPQTGPTGGKGVSQHQRFPNTDAGGATLAKHHNRTWQWWLIGLAALLLALLLTPVASRQVTRLWRLAIISRRLRVGGASRAGGTDAADGAAGAAAEDATASGPHSRAVAGSATPTGVKVGSAAEEVAAAAARARIRAGWLEMRDDLEDFGIGCQPSESPRAVVNRVAGVLGLPPAPRAALRRVALAEERARYADRLDEVPTLRADLGIVRHALARSVSPQVRWRARLFPASKLSAMRRTAQHSLDVFGWAEVATSWLSARVRRRRPAY